MKQKTTILLILLLALFSAPIAQAQSGDELKNPLLFEEDTISMGRMKEPEPNTPIVQQFHFQVLPAQKVKIKEVKPDCACSVASYPEQWLEGGDFASITVRFSPYKLGGFEKSFAIMLQSQQGQEETVTVQLEGYIEPKKPQIALDFPYQCGNLRLRKKLISFGGIGDKTLVKQNVEFYNDSDSPISFLDSMQLPSYIEVVLESDTIQPRSLCRASIFYNPTVKGGFGYSLDNIQLFTDDAVQPKVEMKVAAAVQPEQSIKSITSPEIWMRSETMNLGELPVSNVDMKEIVVRFVVYNRGVNDLIIERVEAGEDVQVVAVSQDIIPNGQSSQIQVQVKNLQGSGEKVRKVYLYTNDPLRPKVELAVIAKLP